MFERKAATRAGSHAYIHVNVTVLFRSSETGVSLAKRARKTRGRGVTFCILHFTFYILHFDLDH